MDDNKKESLMNDNWSKMSAILDREMPVKKNKKRFLIFWWTAAASLVLIFLIPGLHLVFEERSVIAGTKQTLSDEKQTASTFKETKQKVQLNLNKEVKLKGLNTNPVLPVSRLNVQHNTTNKSNKSTQMKSQSKIGHEMIPVMAQNISESSIYDISTVEPILKTNDQSGNDDNSKNSSEEIDYLPLKHTLLHGDQIIGPFIVDVNRPINKWSFGVEANLLTHDYKRAMSTGIGFLADYSLSHKWRLTTSATWKRYHYSSPYYSKNDVFISSLKSMDEFSTTNTASVNLKESEANALRYLLISTITQYVDYAEVSMGTSYSIHKNLNLSGSFLLGINIGAKYAQSTEADQLLTNYNADKLTGTIIAKTNAFHSQYLYKFNVGVDYRIYKSLFAVLRADIFTNEIQTSQDELKAINISTGIFESNEAIVNENSDNKIGLEFGVKYYFE